MKIKSKYKIGAHTFDVHFTKEIDGFANMGQQQHWWNRINLQADMAQSKKESVLFHEVFHEMNGQNGWDINEKQVTAIAEAFYHFLTDNDLLK